MLPYVVIFGAVSALAWHKAKKTNGVPKVLPPNAQHALQKILDAKLPAAKYIKAAEAFEASGLKEEGKLLRKRACLAALPNEEKQKLTNAFGAAMASNKPEGIRAVATVFESKGAVGAAKNLRDQADKVAAANAIQPISHPVAPPTVTAGIEEMADAAILAEEPVTPLPDMPTAAEDASGPPPSPGTATIPAPAIPVVIEDDISENPSDAYEADNED